MMAETPVHTRLDLYCTLCTTAFKNGANIVGFFLQLGVWSADLVCTLCTIGCKFLLPQSSRCFLASQKFIEISTFVILSFKVLRQNSKKILFQNQNYGILPFLLLCTMSVWPLESWWSLRGGAQPLWPHQKYIFFSSSCSFCFISRRDRGYFSSPLWFETRSKFHDKK